MRRQEIAFKDHDSAFIVAEMLMKEGYVVMLSYEEDLIILNYEWSPNANRNDMVFMSRESYELELDATCEEMYNKGVSNGNY